MAQEQIHGNSIISWSADAIATDVNDEIVLMNMERNRCYGLGATGSDVWRKLGSPVRVSEVIFSLQGEYDAAYGTIETDVLAMLAELHSEGLIQIHGED